MFCTGQHLSTDGFYLGLLVASFIDKQRSVRFDPFPLDFKL